MIIKLYPRSRDNVEIHSQILSHFLLEPNDVSMLHEVFIAMVNHQDDAHIQESGCRAVSRLLDNSPSVVALIGEDEEQLSIHNSVFAAMNIHIQDPYVFQASCAALHDLATASSRLQQFLVARGCYVTIVDHMRENIDDAAIQVNLLLASFVAFGFERF